MRKVRPVPFCLILAAAFLCPRAAPAAQPDASPGSVLPEALAIDLKRLEETWNILDLFAEEIWPGWTGYRDVPFLFEYPNGLRMLVGHPRPTDEFAKAEGVDVQGRSVHLDRTGERAIALTPPLVGGGGIPLYGKDTPVRIVSLRLRMRESPPPEGGTQPPEGNRRGTDPLPPRLRSASERQILINIHELFHVFQYTQTDWRHGNLRINADLDFAVYAEIEGLALEKAFPASDDETARGYLKDFLAARGLKRRNMTDLERNQESENEVWEGTAVYAETMTLRLIRREGYEPFMGPNDDPFYYGFEDAEAFLEERLEALRRDRTRTLDTRGNLYRFGCFQALLLSRLFPGWREDFFEDGRFLDSTIAEKLAFPEEAAEARAKTLAERYPVDEIVGRHEPVIQGRDAALAVVRATAGRTYIVNMKPIRRYLTPEARGESYEVGLMNIYPRGIERFEVHDILLTGAETLMLADQLFYLKWVDPAGDPEARGYSLTYDRKEGEDIYHNAEFKTEGFQLKAPKIQVRDTPARVKVTVLEQVRVDTS
jgi:hypothetical protein